MCEQEIHARTEVSNLPPTLDALEQHTNRAIFQFNCWTRVLFPHQELPNPTDWVLKERLQWLGTFVDHTIRRNKSISLVHMLLVQEKGHSRSCTYLQKGA